MASASKAEVCPEAPRPDTAAPTGGDMNDRIGNALVNGCPPPAAPVNEHGDVLPTTKDGTGKIVPLEQVTGDNSEQAILQRLGDRRAELDKREADLNMREAIVEAGEKKLDDKTKALQDLQAQVNALVDQKQAAEDAGFKAVVSMYETMKPKDAAAIFDTLDVNVLLKIARAMNPRKMAPVLAAMSTTPAEILTTALASVSPIATVADTSQTPGALPQIVGH
jgi:flagellar motility protein MotE (MotC chaperone)